MLIQAGIVLLVAALMEAGPGCPSACRDNPEIAASLGCSCPGLFQLSVDLDDLKTITSLVCSVECQNQNDASQRCNCENVKPSIIADHHLGKRGRNSALLEALCGRLCPVHQGGGMCACDLLPFP